MTNAEQVKEINRLIRGVGLNYPAGLEAIRRQLDELSPAKAEVVQPSPTSAAAELPEVRWTASQPPPSDSERRRGPGRPRKVQPG